MKKIIFVFVISIVALQSQAQTKSCCSAPEQFASFSTDIAFVNKHEEPVPFSFVNELGKQLTVTCSDGSSAMGYGIKAATNTNKYIFVFHEWWGLNDYIKKTADQLYTDLGGMVNIIAIDLYDGKVATKRDSAMAYMSGLSQDRAKTIIGAFMTEAGADALVATIGWCMGGGYSLQSAIQLDQRAAGCVMYYGMPETNIEKLQQLNADVLMIWPNQDKWINKEVVDTFKSNMATLNKKLKVEEYDADHAFANPSNPKHNEQAAADAYNKSLDFIKLKLGIVE
jgi:carboxymethylenebutenolidase